MSIYFVLVIYVILCKYIYRDNSKKFTTAAFVGLFIVMAFRNARMVGNDSSSSYYLMFINRLDFTYDKFTNIGLQLLFDGIKLFSDNYQWVIVISAVVVCYSYYKLVSKYSENTFISIMWLMGMLFYTLFFSALKQAWAMAFLCFAFDAATERKLIKYIIFLFIAVMFHAPALIFLPVYWIYGLKLKKSFPLMLEAIFLIVFIFRTRILSLMTSYYGGDIETSGDVAFLGTKVVLMVLIIAYSLLSTDINRGGQDKMFNMLLYFMGIAAVLQTFCFYNNIFERLADYYYVYSVLFMPMLISRKIADSDGNESIFYVTNAAPVLAAIITVFCVARFLSYVTSGADFLSPYYFFWEGLSTF